MNAYGMIRNFAQCPAGLLREPTEGAEPTPGMKAAMAAADRRYERGLAKVRREGLTPEQRAAMATGGPLAAFVVSACSKTPKLDDLRRRLDALRG